jgi:hypothetical protein
MEGTQGVEVRIPVGRVGLEGWLDLPAGAHSLVVFAHGSGSSRFSVRNTMVVRHLGRLGLGTQLFDLLTALEDRDLSKRFDIGLLTDRLVSVTRWLQGDARVSVLRLG